VKQNARKRTQSKSGFHNTRTSLEYCDRSDAKFHNDFDSQTGRERKRKRGVLYFIILSTAAMTQHWWQMNKLGLQSTSGVTVRGQTEVPHELLWD
jgi:hypothetical protein